MRANSLYHFYRQHLEEQLIPFWNRALDHKHGGVYTCFNNAGDRLVSKDKYIWSQGRFLWLWSKIAELVSQNRLLAGEAEGYPGHIHKTALFLEEYAFLENGNCAFLVTETGEKKESVPGLGFDTSIFSDCFVVIGLASCAGLNRDKRRFERAMELYNRIRERIDAGIFRSEPYPVPAGYRPHSIPMIMLNVAQELAESAEQLDHPAGGELRLHCIAYMEDIMENFCLKDDRIAEMLPDDPSKRNTLLYRHLNPGHTIESMWFVIHTARKTGHNDYIHRAARVIQRAMDVGWDPKYEGLLRFVDMKGGKPAGKRTSSLYEQMIVDSWDMKLWWPHSEALYATLLVFVLTCDENMLRMHEKIRKYTFETFPNPDKTTGEWIQIRDRRGDALDKVAALPVKDPFHVLRSLLLILKLLKEMDPKAKFS